MISIYSMYFELCYLFHNETYLKFSSGCSTTFFVKLISSMIALTFCRRVDFMLINKRSRLISASPCLQLK